MLELKDVEVRYGAIVAVRGLSLTVDEGELVALIGANGAGKTTTMLTIAGALRPRQGEITFEGASITGRSSEEIARRGISLVPEDRGIFPSLTVAQNLRLGAYLRRDAAGIRADQDAVFDRFPILAERAKQGAGTLSGGEQQQLAIGRALMARPRLLMLDEPSLGLSPALVDRMYELVDELHREGTTILLVEQNVGRTLEVADRAYLVATGSVAASGTAAELQDVDIASAYLGSRKKEPVASQGDEDE